MHLVLLGGYRSVRPLRATCGPSRTAGSAWRCYT